MSIQQNDRNCNLVKTLYHAAQGEARSQSHASEARLKSDKSAQDFFDNLSKDYNEIACQARLLLNRKTLSPHTLDTYEANDG